MRIYCIPVLPNLFLISYQMGVWYCHHVPTCSRKTHSTKYHFIKSFENWTWHKSDTYKMAVRHILPIVKPIEKVHRNARIYKQNLIIKSKSGEYSFSMKKKRRLLGPWASVGVAKTGICPHWKLGPRSWIPIDSLNSCNVSLFTAMTLTLHKSQVPCILLSCSGELAVHSCLFFFLQRQVAKLASGLFYCWSLVHNNNMAVNLQRFN